MRIPLTLLPHKLRALKLLSPKEVPTYRRSHNGALNGLFPAEQGDNGRWTVDEGDLPLIAKAFSHAAISRTTELPPSAPARKLAAEPRSSSRPQTTDADSATSFTA